MLAVAAALATTACYQPAETGGTDHVPKIQAAALVEEALATVETGDLEKALRLLGEAIEVDPEFAVPYQDRALLLAQLGRLSEAIASIEDAIIRSSDPGEALLAKGILLEQDSRMTEAKEAYAAASDALAQPAADPAKDLRRRLAWAHAEYLLKGMPGGVRAINDVLARYPGQPLAEMYRVRILANRRETMLGLHAQPAGEAQISQDQDQEE
jgi:tetratricopeptide (TPR) repeat protein